MKKIINNLKLKVGVFMHNLGYALISKSSVVLNEGSHPKHEIMGYHKFFVDNIEGDESVLDIGCGNGLLAIDIAKKAKKVVGIDINNDNVKKAKKLEIRGKLDFFHGDATVFDFREKFDVVVLSNVLEHIKERKGFLIKVSRLAPKILIRVPLITRSWLPIYLKQKGFWYMLDKTHYIEYTEEDFSQEIKNAGLKIDKYYVKWGELYAICSINATNED